MGDVGDAADRSELTLASLGLADVAQSEMSIDHIRLVAATLDEPPPIDRLPLLWHWACFNSGVPTAALGADGHPQRHDTLAEAFPRRMWVGGHVHVHSTPRLGVTATRRSRIIEHVRKHGSSGDLLIVAIEHVVEQDGHDVITERQDVVYRAATGATSPAGPAIELAVAEAAWRDDVLATPELLFRFSAVTFNTHRIHYDQAYASAIEGYPGLVVQGPLTAMLLARSAVRRLSHEPREVSFRAMAPLFAGAPITLVGTMSDGRAAVTALRIDGVTAMSLTAG